MSHFTTAQTVRRVRQGSFLALIGADNPRQAEPAPPAPPPRVAGPSLLPDVLLVEGEILIVVEGADARGAREIGLRRGDSPVCRVSVHEDGPRCDCTAFAAEANCPHVQKLALDGRFPGWQGGRT